MDTNSSYFQSSIGKKQVVAVTGLALILFVIGHLAGNLIIFLGPDAFNAYAKKLAGLRPGLYLIEFGLAVVFIIHMWFTAVIVWENVQARKNQYAVAKNVGERSFATRIMPYTGTIILVFVIYHLLDFTFIDHHGSRAFLNGKDYGLYGVVVNSFRNGVHSGLYIIAMACLGFHLSHGIQSFAQTFGFNHPKYTPIIKRVSNYSGLLIAFGYSLIPIAILFSS